MNAVVVCTSVYPAGVSHWEAYCRGLKEAVGRFDGPVHLVLASDGVESADLQLGLALIEGVPVKFCRAPEGSSTAGVRRTMLHSAASLQTDTVVCFDMDDIPNADSLALHVETLQRADISYGDMHVIDTHGAEVLSSYFRHRCVPNEVRSVDPLSTRNFMGFTNTAVRGRHIPSVASRIPGDVEFVDWWFFSNLMISGCSAQKTSGTVVSYRIHEKNAIGSGAASDLVDLKKRCSRVLAHFCRMPTSAVFHCRAARVQRLLQLIEEEPEDVLEALKELPKHLLWHEDVALLARQFGDQP